MFYVTALFSMFRYDNGVVCILIQLNPSRHFNVCFKYCQKTQTVGLLPQTKLNRSYFVELLANSSVCVCVRVCVFYSFDFLKKKKLLFYGYYCTSKDF